MFSLSLLSLESNARVFSIILRNGENNEITKIAKIWPLKELEFKDEPLTVCQKGGFVKRWVGGVAYIADITYSRENIYLNFF